MIEQALACGETVVIENLPEKVDPVLEPLLGRNTIKRGRLVINLQYCTYTVVLLRDQTNSPIVNALFC